MPEMMNMYQPQQVITSPRPPQGLNSFPEYLKHVELIGDVNPQIKLTASNNLFHAVLKGRVRGVRMLLDRGVSINGRNDYGYSVLTAALHIDDDRRRQKLFQILLEKGADPLFKDEGCNRSVLHWTCILGRTEELKLLLSEVCGDLDFRDKDNASHTPLHHAVMAGHLDIVKMLVDVHKKFGVSVDIADNIGLTPYLHAKRLGYREIADYLHGHGQASVGHADRLFRTPREWSQIGKFERQESVKIHTQEAINFAKIRGKITHVRRLESYGLPITENGNAVPHIPVVTSSPSPGVKDHFGVTGSPRRYNGFHRERLSQSLPSLKEHGLNGHHRPFSANGHSEEAVDSKSSINRPIDIQFRLRRQAFAANSHDEQDGAHADHHHPGTMGSESAPTTNSVHWTEELTRKGPGNIEAFHLMEMNSRGKHARTYRQSQFDESKASEYNFMLNTLMNVLADQQSKSFRKSVKYQRPETPKKKKQKNKVSTLAVIFGRDKGGRRGKKTHRHGSSSPKSPKLKGDKASPKNEKGGGSAKKEKGDKGAAGEEKAKKNSEAEPSERKRNVVPLLKVNDTVV